MLGGGGAETGRGRDVPAVLIWDLPGTNFPAHPPEFLDGEEGPGHEIRQLARTRTPEAAKATIRGRRGRPARGSSRGRRDARRSGSGTGSPASFPVTLHTGDKITVPVTFKPAVPAGVTGTLSFATPSASLPSTDVPLAGQGLSTGLYADAPAVQFALVGDHGQFLSWVPANISVPREMTITNGSAVPQRITSVSAPTAPYRVTGLPPAGTVLAPGQSFVVQVTITPHGQGVFNSSLSVAGSSGAGATVSLQSQGLAPVSQFTVSPSSLDLGSVPAGRRVEASFTITNSGNQPATAINSSGPGGPFRAEAAVLPGLPVNPSDDLTIRVGFTPPHKGRFSTRYQLVWKDSSGTHIVTVPITGTGV